MYAKNGQNTANSLRVYHVYVDIALERLDAFVAIRHGCMKKNPRKANGHPYACYYQDGEVQELPYFPDKFW